MPRLAIALIAIMVTAFAVSALGHGVRSGGLQLGHPWARATAGVARNGVAYLTIVNHGREADRLIGVAAPVARKAALHTHIFEGGIVKTRPVAAITVHPGKPAVLKPGGSHIMLMGLKAPLVVGTRFPRTLVFERAGEIAVEVVVEAPGAMRPAPGKGRGHGKD